MAKKCDGAQWQHLRVTPLLWFVCPCCPVSLSLSWPCPLLLLPRALSHMLSLALSSHSQTRESAAPGSHLHLSCFSFAPLPSCCTLSTSTYCHSAAETLLGETKNPPALHQRQDTGEGKTSGGNRLGIPHRTEESLFFSSFWWLTCSADSPLKGNT